MKSRMLILALVPLLVSASEPAWKYVVEYANGNVLLLRTSSIAKSGKYRKAWFKRELKTPLEVPKYMATATQVSGKFKYAMELSYFNCAERTSTTIQAVYYSENDELVGSYDMKLQDAHWSDAAPETVQEQMITAVCGAPMPQG